MKNLIFLSLVFLHVINLAASPNEDHLTFQLEYQSYTTENVVQKESEDNPKTIDRERFDEKTWDIMVIGKNEYQVELIQNQSYSRQKEDSAKWRTTSNNYSFLPGEKNFLLHKIIIAKVVKDSVSLTPKEESLISDKKYTSNINELKKILTFYLLQDKGVSKDAYSLIKKNKDGSLEYKPTKNKETTYSPESFFKLKNKTGLGSDYDLFFEPHIKGERKIYSYQKQDSTVLSYDIHSTIRENLKTIVTTNEPYKVIYRDENFVHHDSVYSKTNATLRGRIKNFDPETHISIDFSEDLPGSYKRKAFVFYPDKEGNFEFKMYLDKPMEFTFWHKESTPFVLAPGDDLYLTLDMNEFDETVKWSGTGSEKNQFMAARFLSEESKELDDSNYYQKISKQHTILEPEQFKAFCDSLSQIRYDFVKNYFSVLRPTEYLGIYYNEYLNNFLFKKRYNGDQNYYRKKENLEPFTVDDSFYDFKEDFHANNDLMSFASNYEYSIREIVFFGLFDDIQDKYAIPFESMEQHYNNRILYTKLFYSGITQYTLEYITLGDVFENSSWDQAVKMMADFSKEYQGTYYNDILQTVYDKAETVSPGQMAYDFELDDLDGNKVKLSDYKGKVVYIDFWSTGCGPCRYQIENCSGKLEEKMKGKDIVFIYIACENNVDRVKKYLQKNNIEGVFLIAKDKEAIIRDKFWFNGIPHYYIVGRDGSIVQRDAHWPSELLMNPDQLINAL